MHDVLCEDLQAIPVCRLFDSLKMETDIIIRSIGIGVWLAMVIPPKFASGIHHRTGGRREFQLTIGIGHWQHFDSVNSVTFSRAPVGSLNLQAFALYKQKSTAYIK